MDDHVDLICRSIRAIPSIEQLDVPHSIPGQIRSTQIYGRGVDSIARDIPGFWPKVGWWPKVAFRRVQVSASIEAPIETTEIHTTATGRSNTDQQIRRPALSNTLKGQPYGQAVQ